MAEVVNGSIDCSTLGGHIEILQAKGSVKSKSAGGAVTIWKANAAVDAIAPAGSIKVNFVDQPAAASKLETGAGSIIVGYQANHSFKIDANTANGKIRGPFLDNTARVVSYEMNGGDQELAIASGNGSIRFQEIDLAQLDEFIAQRVESRRGSQAFQRAYDIHMSGRIDQAIIAHQKAAQYEEYKAIATYNLGCAWALKGETEKAIAALRNALDWGFDDLEQYLTDEDLDSLRNDERFKELISEMKQAGGDSYSECDDRLDEVNSLLQKGKDCLIDDDFVKAERRYQTAIDIDPENELATVKLGPALQELGRLDEAYGSHQRSSKSKAYSGIGNDNLAYVHAQRGEKEQALSFLKLAIKNGFTQTEHMMEDEDLNRLRDHPEFEFLMRQAEGESDGHRCGQQQYLPLEPNECDL